MNTEKFWACVLNASIDKLNLEKFFQTNCNQNDKMIGVNMFSSLAA